MSALLVLDLLGVFVFALSGASLAVEKQLDLFGVLVLAVVTALGGGLLRDVLLGDTPPVALRESRYLVVALVAGLVVFLGSPLVEHIAAPVRVFDAAGLGLFVATGTAKALHAGMGAVPAITLGCLTGIGGGIARDVLVGVVPVVLRRELYAVPAVLGAAVVTAGDGIGAAGSVTAAVAAVVVFTIRVLGVWRDWHFPVARR
ncbi:MAG: trimeric intracellular cation channel family protein [Mycobacteriales bacterium]